MGAVTLTFTGTPLEMAAILEKVNGEPAQAATRSSVSETPAVTPAATSDSALYTAKELEKIEFGELKRIAKRLKIDLTGKRSAGLRKAILEAQEGAEDDDEEEDEEADEVEDEDESEEESEDEDDEDEDDDWEDEDDEEEDEPEPPRPTKRAPAKKAAAAKKAPARRRRA